jgi:hypothetical protein
MSKTILMARTYDLMPKEHQDEIGIKIIDANIFNKEIYFELDETD